MGDDVAEIAKSLTKAQREAVVYGKCALPPSNQEYSSDCICAASHCEDLCKLEPPLAYPRTVWPSGIVLTTLGLAVRAALTAAGYEIVKKDEGR